MTRFIVIGLGNMGRQIGSLLKKCSPHNIIVGVEKNLPKIVLAPTTIVMIVCMYGFIVWTGLISLTKSRMMPQWEFVGLDQYVRLFNNPRWHVAVDNLLIFLILLSIVGI